MRGSPPPLKSTTVSSNDLLLTIAAFMAGPSGVGSTTAQRQPRPPPGVLQAQELTTATSDKYVPSPKPADVLANQIETLVDFRGRLRRRAAAIKLRHREQEDDQPNPANPGVPRRADDGNDRDFWIEAGADAPSAKPPEGLNTGLYCQLKGSPDIPSDHPGVENFLAEFETILGSQIRERVLYKDKRRTSDFDKSLYEAVGALAKEEEWMLVPTDKTNGWKPVRTAEYIRWMRGHLDTACKPVSEGLLSDIFARAQQLLAEIGGMLSAGEREYLQNWVQQRLLPMPRLLIKDHKRPKADGSPATRLLVPATNFTQCYAKVGYMTIRALFDARGVPYAARTIIQASHLKQTLDRLGPFKKSDVTIAALDIADMYPSIKFQLISKAVA